MIGILCWILFISAFCAGACKEGGAAKAFWQVIFALSFFPLLMIGVACAVLFIGGVISAL